MRRGQIQNVLPILLTLVIIGMVLTLGTYGFHSLAKTSSKANEQRFWSGLQSTADSYASSGSLKPATLSLPAGEFLCAFDTSLPASERRCDGFNAELCRKLQSYWLAAGPQDNNVVLSTGDGQRINGLSFGDAHYACIQGPQAHVFFTGEGTSASLSPYVPVSVTRQGNGDTVSVGSTTPGSQGDVVTATGPALAYNGLNIQNTMTFTAQPAAMGNVIAATARAIDVSRIATAAKFEPKLSVSITNPTNQPVQLTFTRIVPSWLATSASDLSISVPPDSITRTAQGLELTWKSLVVPPGGLTITITGSTQIDSSTVKNALEDPGSLHDMLTPQVAIAYPPRISGFSASPSSVEPGGAFKLSYSVENMLGNCTGTGLIAGTQLPPTGLDSPLTVPSSAHPGKAVSLGISCTNPAGSSSNETSIKIVGCTSDATCGSGNVCTNGACAPDPQAPVIKGFSVSKRSVIANEGFTLSYEIINAQASDCRGLGILAGLGPVPVPNWGSGSLYFNATDALGAHTVGINCTTEHGSAQATAQVMLVGSACSILNACRSGQECINGRCTVPAGPAAPGVVYANATQNVLHTLDIKAGGSSGSSTAPLAGVSVSVQGTNGACTTAADGTCNIARLSYGTYRVSFKKSGFDTKTVSVTLSSGSPTAHADALLSVSTNQNPEPNPGTGNGGSGSSCSKDSGPVCGLPVSAKCPQGSVCTQQLTPPKTYESTCALVAADAEFLYPGACRTGSTPSEPNCADPTPVCGVLNGKQDTYASNCALVAAGGDLVHKGPCSSSVGYSVRLGVYAGGVFGASTEKSFSGTLATGGTADVTVNLAQSVLGRLVGNTDQCSFTARVTNDGGTISCKALDSVGSCSTKIVSCQATGSSSQGPPSGSGGSSGGQTPSNPEQKVALSISSNARAKVSVYRLASAGQSGGIGQMIDSSSGSVSSGPGTYAYVESCYTPCSLSEAPGIYSLRTSADGYISASKDLKLSSDQSVRFTLEQQVLTYKATLALSNGIWGTQAMVKTGQLPPGGQLTYTHYFGSLFGNSCMLKVRVENRGGKIVCSKIDGWGGCTPKYTCERTGVANAPPPLTTGSSGGSSSGGSSSGGSSAGKVCGALSCTNVGSCSGGQQQQKCTCSYSGAVSTRTVSCGSSGSSSSGSSSGGSTAFCDQPQNANDPECRPTTTKPSTSFCQQNPTDPECRPTTTTSGHSTSPSTSTSSDSGSSSTGSGSTSPSCPSGEVLCAGACVPHGACNP